VINHLISKLKNSLILKKLYFEILLNNFDFKIIYCLYKYGFINGLLLIDYKKYIIFFKYINNKSIIRNIKQISKPGKRIYLNYFKFNNTRSIYFKKLNGFLLISTNKGLLIDELLNLKNIGGEVILKVN
jgi:small subunit ribosomal protein S8